jgi:hypothetical protein
MPHVAEKIRAASTLGVRGPSLRGEYQLCCPFCEAATGKPDLKFKLYLNPAKGVYYCQKCAVGGKIDLTWLAKVEAVEEAPVDPLKLGPPEGFTQLTHRSSSVKLQPYSDYLCRRGLLDAAINVGAGACLSGRFAGRVIFPHAVFKEHCPQGCVPISDHLFGASMMGNYRWAGFSARAIYDGMEPKYLYPAGMPRGTTMWGGFLPHHNELWLVEGVIDALAIYPMGVAAFGKNVTEEQLDIFAKWAHNSSAKPVVCLDGDAWEDCIAIAMRLALRDVHKVHWARLPPKTDPGMLRMEVRKYVRAL